MMNNHDCSLFSLIKDIYEKENIEDKTRKQIRLKRVFW